MRVYVTSRGRVGAGCGCLPLVLLGAVVAAGVWLLAPLGAHMNGPDAWWITTLVVLGPLALWWIAAEIRNARR